MKVLSTKQIIGLAATLILIVGLLAATYLVQRQQIIKSKATAPAGNFVNAFEIREQLPNGSPGPVITCDDSTGTPVCTTKTLNIQVKVKDPNALLP